MIRESALEIANRLRDRAAIVIKDYELLSLAAMELTGLAFVSDLLTWPIAEQVIQRLKSEELTHAEGEAIIAMVRQRVRVPPGDISGQNDAKNG